eukprot:SAG22_NODE_671_length_7976_cov_15.231560_2_plen_232_part_00
MSAFAKTGAALHTVSSPYVCPLLLALGLVRLSVDVLATCAADADNSGALNCTEFSNYAGAVVGENVVSTVSQSLGAALALNPPGDANGLDHAHAMRGAASVDPNSPEFMARILKLAEEQSTLLQILAHGTTAAHALAAGTAANELKFDEHTFDAFDEDNNGHLDVAELHTMIEWRPVATKSCAAKYADCWSCVEAGCGWSSKKGKCGAYKNKECIAVAPEQQQCDTKLKQA